MKAWLTHPRAPDGRTTSSSSGPPGSPAALTAEYLAADAPDGLRWALAGRNPAKLEASGTRLAGLGKAGAASS